MHKEVFLSFVLLEFGQNLRTVVYMLFVLFFD